MLQHQGESAKGNPGFPAVQIAEHVVIPQLGLGVWQIDARQVTEVVSAALEAGYRLIDTAQGYDNETGVGRAIAHSPVPREALFITSKLRTRAMGFDGARRGVEASLEALGLDYLDLMLIHWPTLDRERYVGAWKGLIEAREQGLVRSIGVSNFLEHHIEAVIEETGVVPAIDQVETHPYFQQNRPHAYLAARGIAHQAYSPLGHGEVLANEVIADIARNHGRTPAQVVLSWHRQRGSVVIPKSVHPDRLRENLEAVDLTLSEADMGRIAGLDRGEDGRTGSDPDRFNDLY